MNRTAIVLSLMFTGLADALVTPRAALAEDMQTAAVRPMPGKMLYSVDGQKLAPIYKVDANGAAVILMQGGVFTIPAATLTMSEGKMMTTMTKRQLFVR